MPTHLERKDLINTQDLEVAVYGANDDTHRALLGIGLANLSSGSHGTFTFLWLLDVPDTSVLEELPQQPAQQFKSKKKIIFMFLLMLNWGRSFLR